MCAVTFPSSPWGMRCRATRLCLMVGLILMGAMNFSAPASAQGLFEALFGRQNSAAAPSTPSFYPPIYHPRYRPDAVEPRRLASTPRQLRDPRRVGRHSATEEGSGPKKYVAPEVLPGPLGQFLRDPTLKRGDVVATSRGLMVFRGASGRSHQASDFVALSSGARHAAGNRADLAALEKAIGRLRNQPEPAAQGAQVAQAGAPVVAQDDARVRRKKRAR